MYNIYYQPVAQCFNYCSDMFWPQFMAIFSEHMSFFFIFVAYMSTSLISCIEVGSWKGLGVNWFELAQSPRTDFDVGILDNAMT